MQDRPALRTDAAPARAVPALAADLPEAAPAATPRLERADGPVPAELPPPPMATPRPHRVAAGGLEWTDEYHWLRERENPEVIAHLEAENAYTDAVMARAGDLPERVFREMVARIQETDLSVPEAIDGWLYYSRTEAGKQYPIFCRRRGSMEAPEEVLLDQNLLAEGKDYCRVAALEPSPDHALLAWTVDHDGSEEYVLEVKDLRTGALLPDRVAPVAGNLAWAADSRTLFYTTLDATHRPWRVHRHRLGTDPALDPVVLEERDEAFFAHVHLARSRAVVLVDLASHTSSESWFIPADRPEEVPRVIRPRAANVEYEVEHHGDRFLLLTNAGARNFRLMSVPVGDPGTPGWVEVIPGSDAVKLDGLDAFERHLVVYERERGLRQVRVIPDAGEPYRIPFPEPVYSIRRNENPDHRTRVLRFTYTSLVTPSSVIDWDLDARTWTMRKQQVVNGGYDAAHYRSERVHAVAPDGVEVPISLVWKEPLVRDGARPLFLQGYGAYGSSWDPAFSSPYLSLLDRGFVVGIAHVRGGEELGRAWYEDGKLARKPNTFTDFIACAEHLVREGWTAPGRLAINGGSAGGLLMGAVANLRPDLFGAVTAEVPFVDVVHTMLDPTLPLTVIEYDEWGNPNDPEVLRLLRSYSPYDNVRAQAYPPMLVTAGLNDPRVQYWEPAKWVARLRARKTDGNPLVLRTNMGAGHAGASGRYDYLREIAFKYAFVLHVLGVDG